MAKLTLNLIPIPIPAISLFLLFSLSESLPTSDLNGGDVLLLPSDIPRAVHDTGSPAAVADPKSAIAVPEHELENFVTVPLTKLDFHEGGMPLSLRFPHGRRFGRGFRHGFMLRHGMRPREIPYGNDMILSNGQDRAEEFVGRSRFHWVNRRPRFEVAAPWKGEEDVLQRPKMLERGFDEEEMFRRPEKFQRHDEDEDDDVFKRPKKFDHDDENHMFEMVEKHKPDTPRKFMHHDDDDDDWHREEHRHRHHHKHHHDEEEEDGAHKHGKHHHHDDDEDDKSGILSNMRKFFDDLF